VKRGWHLRRSLRGRLAARPVQRDGRRFLRGRRGAADLGGAFDSLRAPGEAAAAARTRRAVLAAHAAAPVTRRRRGPAIAAVVAALALAGGLASPAVGDWLRDVVEHPKPPPVAPPPVPLPAGGRLLVGTGGGVGLSPAGRAPDAIGRYRDATWSPGGRFAAVTTRHALLAVTPHGAVRWRVAGDAPRSPAWSPDGFRIAYLAGAQLRVVVADGTDDRLFRGHVRPVAPAFRPGAGRTVAWVDADDHVRVADVDLARLQWRSPVPVGRARALSWSADGNRLLVAGRHRVQVFALASGGVRSHRAHGPVAAAAFPPRGGGPPAILERSRLRLLGRREPLIETRGRYHGLVWSPDGRWILTRRASQWIVVRADGRRIVTAASRGRPLGWTR
jgi:hypothetical protein